MELTIPRPILIILVLGFVNITVACQWNANCDVCLLDKRCLFVALSNDTFACIPKKDYKLFNIKWTYTSKKRCGQVERAMLILAEYQMDLLEQELPSTTPPPQTTTVSTPSFPSALTTTRVPFPTTTISQSPLTILYTRQLITNAPTLAQELLSTTPLPIANWNYWTTKVPILHSTSALTTTMIPFNTTTMSQTPLTIPHTRELITFATPPAIPKFIPPESISPIIASSTTHRPDLSGISSKIPSSHPISATPEYFLNTEIYTSRALTTLTSPIHPDMKPTCKHEIEEDHRLSRTLCRTARSVGSWARRTKNTTLLAWNSQNPMFYDRKKCTLLFDERKKCKGRNC